MLFGVAFIFGLMVLGAIVAYVGDKVGHRVGKKKLSLFGLRPKYTSVIVSVTTGVLIVAVTITVMVVASNDVRTALFGVDELRQTVSTLERNVSAKNAELNQLLDQLSTTEALLRATQQEYESTVKSLELVEADLNAARDRIVELQGTLIDLESQVVKLEEDGNKLRSQNQALEKQNRDWIEQNTALRAENVQLSEQIKGLRVETVRLQEETRSLEEKKAELEKEKDFLSGRIRDLTEIGEMVYTSLVDLREGSIIFNSREVLIAGKVSGNQPVESIKEKLKILLQLAAKVAEDRGAGRDSSGNVLLLQKAVYDPVEDNYRFLTLEQILDVVAKVIHDQAGDGSAIVRVVSTRNTLGGEPVLVDFELFENKLVFRKGDLVSETVINGGALEEKIFSDILAWLKKDVNAAAGKAGMLPTPQGTYGEVGPDQVYRLAREIHRRGETVVLSAHASRDTWTAGPLELEYRLSKFRTDTTRGR